MIRSDSEPLGPFVEMDEALVDGKGGRGTDQHENALLLVLQPGLQVDAIRHT